MRFAIESDAVAGTPADSWDDLAGLIGAWLNEPQDECEFEETARAIAARAVLLAGGEMNRE
jgi:hypothetical protein